MLIELRNQIYQFNLYSINRESENHMNLYSINKEYGLC